MHRLENMRVAVDHLHEAGLHDIADHVAERAHGTEREMNEQREHLERERIERENRDRENIDREQADHRHHHDPMQEVMRQLDELRRQIGHLHGEIEHLRNR